MNCEIFWNVFTDTIIPVLIAVAGVYFAEHFARKRDYRQKQVEIQIDYLREEIEYLAKMENLLLILSRQVVNYLGKTGTDERIKKYNEVIGELSTFNERNISSSYKLDCFNKAMNIEIDIENYKKAMGRCVENIKKICDDALNGPVDEKCKLQINEDVQIAKEKIEEAIKLITKQMSLVMKNI